MRVKAFQTLLLPICLLGASLAHSGGTDLTITEAFALGETLIVRGHDLCKVKKHSSQVVTLGTVESVDELTVSGCIPDADPSRNLDELAAALPVGLSAATYQLVIDNDVDAKKSKSSKNKSKKSSKSNDEYRDEFDFAYGTASLKDLLAETTTREAFNSDEALTRAAADEALQADLAAEVAAREAADASEAATRNDADTVLQASLLAEAIARENADVTLQSDITTEASDRAAADQALSADITANAAAIEDLNGQVGLMSGQIDAINTNIDDLETDVQINIDDLASLDFEVQQMRADPGVTQGQLDAVSADLDALEALHAAGVVELQDQIDDQQTLIDDLRQDLTVATSDLSGQLAALQTAVAGNTGNINSLLVDVATALAEIATINITLDDDETRLENLEGSLTSISTDINAIQADIVALGNGLVDITGDVALLQSIHYDPQCFESFATLDDASRSVNNANQAPLQCDFNLAAGWYRFTGFGGDHIPTSAPSIKRCQTSATGWMNGQLPLADDGVVTREACFNFGGDTCKWARDIKVVSCPGFYLYELNGRDLPGCSLRYCTTN